MVEGSVTVRLAGGAWELAFFRPIVFLVVCCLFVRFRRSFALLYRTVFLSCSLYVFFPPPPNFLSTEARGSCHTPLCGALASHRPDAGGHPRHQHPAATTAGCRGGRGGGHCRLGGGAENQGCALGVWLGFMLVPPGAVTAARCLSHRGCRCVWAPALMHLQASRVLPVATVCLPRARGHGRSAF